MKADDSRPGSAAQVSGATGTSARAERGMTVGTGDERQAAEQRTQPPSWFRSHERGVIGVAAVAVVLLIWEVLERVGFLNPVFTSSPVRIVAQARIYFTSPNALEDLRVSGTEFVVGFVLAIVVGVTLGVLVGWYRHVEYALDPFITFLYTSPRIAFMPLLIIWLGIGLASKVAIVFLGAVFPIIISTAGGIKSTDAALLRVARSFNASDRQIFSTVALPGAVPSIISGLRLGLAHGLIGIVVGELVAATAGVGYRMTQAGANFQTDLVFVLLGTIATVGVLLTALMRRLERRFDRWRPELHSA